MLERSAEIDDLAGRIFLAEHFCSRAIQAPEASEPVGEVRVWMELNDFDQAPIARSAGKQVVLRSALVGVAPDCPVADMAMATPAEHWLDGTAPLQQALTALAQRDWLLVLNHAALLVSLRDALGYPSRSSFEHATGGLVALRNHLAHGRSILTLPSRPAEAVERIQGLEELMGSVRRLLDDREHVWDAFASTEIIGVDDDPVIWAGRGATALPLPEPVHVITAQNPHERVLEDNVNNERHQLLHHYLELRFPNAGFMEVISRSSSGPWAEASWAISDLTRPEALAIAQRFQQRAIFELTESDQLVIGIDGQERRRNKRCR